VAGRLAGIDAKLSTTLPQIVATAQMERAGHTLTLVASVFMFEQSVVLNFLYFRKKENSRRVGVVSTVGDSKVETYVWNKNFA
jgi:hypothetical protein